MASTRNFTVSEFLVSLKQHDHFYSFSNTVLLPLKSEKAKALIQLMSLLLFRIIVLQEPISLYRVYHTVLQFFCNKSVVVNNVKCRLKENSSQNNATQLGSSKNWQKVVVTIALLYYSNIADYQNPQQIYCSKVGSFLLMFKGKRVP